MKTEYTVRYAAYAAAHNRTPDGQLKADGNMGSYIIWIQGAWQQWEAAHGEKPELGGFHSPAQHEAFDEWLQTEFLDPEK